ncbi:Retrovirus-related Pol polyprotein from transposon 297 [Phytophthora citrophthora]|uniref:Retrovirus-related Pol polyprotein from transposon 297 n=1 Tax=Phytophthora citrophthora TaxID=4793 RepID=A0AAD9G171_9STRA|nr:Retrovirus-related Pol polyprotein from transposon 297 [Phytophthora citrophthora]
METRVIGVWRFVGTTLYQQQIIVDALLIEGQGDELLIGEDWMVDKGVKMDFASRELKYYDEHEQKIILPFTCHGISSLQQPSQRRKIMVRLAKTRKLNTGTCNVVTMRVDAEEGTTGIYLPKPTTKRHLLIAPTVDVVRNGQVRVQVMNVEGRREKLPAREALGKWIPVTEDMKLLSLNGELERERVIKWVSTLRKEDAKPLKDEDKLDIGEMEQKDRDLVFALLRQYSEIVEKKSGYPPKAKIGVEHHINTGDAAPIMMRRRRHAVAENELIDKEVDDMLAQGVIEPGEGAWGFPVVIVRKKDGSVRFCIDYRALNSVTLKDVYPLPRVDETLEARHGSQRFSSLDLHAGYWQLGVFGPDKPKTAFTTRRGLFQFTRMPFGLCNAPSTFQRRMDCVLRGLTWVCCLVYLDDVVILTKRSVTQHVVELAVVLERLAEAGLSLKVSKCSFATTRMEYLGHDLTPEGIQPTPRLVKAIVDFPTPTDDSQVRRVVALAGYYRRFVPEFGTKMAPLTCLLHRSQDWIWGPAQEEAFVWAKAWLSQNPVLIYPDYSLPFKLTTDA